MVEQTQPDSEVRQLSRVLKDHFALILAVILGLCHYNGIVSWYYYTDSFGVSGLENQEVYLTISVGFVILIFELVLILFVFATRTLIQVILVISRRKNVEVEMRHWRRRLSSPGKSKGFWFAGTYASIFFLIFAPPISGVAYAEYGRTAVDMYSCKGCVSVTTATSTRCGRIISSDPDRFAIYTGDGIVEIFEWAEIESVGSKLQ